MYRQYSHTMRNCDPIDLRKLVQFIEVAEREHVTQAAAELHLTQQAVSASIRQLERDLGAPLFERGGRRVRLTKSGRTLLDGAQPLLAAAAALAESTRAAAFDLAAPFVVAHSPAVTPGEVFDLVSPICRAFPELSITARQMYPEEMIKGLREGTVDVGFRRGVRVPGALSAAVIAHSTLRLAVPARHRFAGRASVSLTEIGDETLMLWAPPGDSAYSDYLIGLCRRAGVDPRVAVNRVQGTPPITAVLDRDCIAFVTEEAGPAHRGRAWVVDIDDAPKVAVQALWLGHSESPARSVLLACGRTDRGVVEGHVESPMSPAGRGAPDRARRRPPLAAT